MMSVVVLNVLRLSVIMLSDIVLSIIMLSVIMLGVIMLSVIMLIVVAPSRYNEPQKKIYVQSYLLLSPNDWPLKIFVRKTYDNT